MLLITKSKQGAQLPPESASWQEFHLPPPEFSELRQRLKRDRLLNYFENELRWDYSPKGGGFALRLMTTPLHEILQEELSHHITNILNGNDSWASHEISDMASKIKSCGHAAVFLGSIDGKETIKCPDLQLRYDGGAKPPFIAEIAYSQRTKPLKQLARDYVTHEIKTVLTLDVEYDRHRKSTAAAETKRKAVYCLYRGPKRVHKNTPFRNDDGSPAPGTLRLELADFFPGQVLQDVTKEILDSISNCHIEITHELLCKWLESAEIAQRGQDKDKRTIAGQVSLEWSDTTDDDDDDDVDDNDGSDGSDEGGSDEGGSDEEEISLESKKRSKKCKASADLQYCPSSFVKAAAAVSAGKNSRSKR